MSIMDTYYVTKEEGIVSIAETEALACLLQAERSGNPSDWVLAGAGYLYIGDTEMHKYCQHMADALRRRERAKKKAVDGKKRRQSWTSAA